MLTWSEQQRDLRRGVSRWAEALSADHVAWDERAEFPWCKWSSIRESGILRTPFPAAYGGLEQDLCTTMYVLEELGHGCEDGGLSFAVTTHMVSAGVPLMRFGTEEQRARFLPSVADGSRICGHAVRDGNEYVLEGQKTFISNGPIGELFVVYAMTDRRAGALGGATALLVPSDTRGFSAGPPQKKMGLRTAPLCDLVFDRCRVPASHVIGREGLGFPILEHVMKWEILCSFIVSIGEMQRRLEKCVQYAKTRTQFGQTIGSFQSVANKLVEMRMGVDVSRAWLYRTAEKVQRNENTTIDVAIAKLLASEHAIASAMHAVQIFGGYGYMTEYGLEKDLRNSVAGAIYSGTSDIQRNRIAKMMGL
jgi:alkylation response protein AidB-like acyl-CoA dehydrogenase